MPSTSSRAPAFVILCLLLSAASTLHGTPFRRGDANQDAIVDITDAIGALGYLFLGEPASLACEDAADSNDDAEVNTSDAITTLSYLFLGTGSLPAPGPDACGEDPTPDELPCLELSGCDVTDERPPSRPTIALLVPTAATILAHWIGAEDDATPASRLRYDVHVLPSADAPPDESTLRASVVGETRVEIAELTPSTTYYVTLMAVDEAGRMSQLAPVVTSTTTAASPVPLAHVSMPSVAPGAAWGRESAWAEGFSAGDCTARSSSQSGPGPSSCGIPRVAHHSSNVSIPLVTCRNARAFM